MQSQTKIILDDHQLHEDAILVPITYKWTKIHSSLCILLEYIFMDINLPLRYFSQSHRRSKIIFGHNINSITIDAHIVKSSFSYQLRHDAQTHKCNPYWETR